MASVGLVQLGQQRRVGAVGGGRDGLAAADQRHDLIRLSAQVTVGPEGVIPPALRAKEKENIVLI